MHVLQIVVKNTSTLDSTIPLFRDLKEDGKKLTVLYCSLNRTQILRQSTFYSDVTRQNGGVEMDYADFLRPLFKPFRALIWRIFAGSPADKLHLRESYRSYQSEGAGHGPIRFLVHVLGTHGVGTLLHSTTRNIVVYFERRFLRIMVDLDRVLPRLAPDLVIFDNRATKRFHGWHEFLAYFRKRNIPVLLVPHAPHYRNPIGEFCGFDESGTVLPPYCHHWSPMKYGRPEEAPGATEEQITRIGYPGLDADWLRSMRRQEDTARGEGEDPLSCLFIIRRYVPKGEPRQRDLDPYIVDYTEFRDPLDALADAVEAVGREIEVVVKPHPSNDYTALTKELEQSSLVKWRITYEPVYGELADVDFVVSLFSTILLVPAMAGVPTVVLESSLQRHVHCEWPLLERLYTGMSHYTELSQLTRVLRGIVSDLSHGVRSTDPTHLREFFPDGATSRAASEFRRLGGK